jgi:hypothetical protein
MFEEVRVNELNDLIQKGWLEVGTGTDAGKYRLSATGIVQFNRLVESLDAKSQTLISFELATNAYKTPTEIKAFMQ